MLFPKARIIVFPKNTIARNVEVLSQLLFFLFLLFFACFVVLSLFSLVYVPQFVYLTLHVPIVTGMCDICMCVFSRLGGNL